MLVPWTLILDPQRQAKTVKKILRSCVIYNKLEGVPYSSVIPPDLPSFRTSDKPPFSHTGIDYAGPLCVKDDNQLKKGLCVPLYVLINADCSLRIGSGSVCKFILLLFHRFVSRRGLPVTLISDNARPLRYHLRKS